MNIVKSLKSVFLLTSVLYMIFLPLTQAIAQFTPVPAAPAGQAVTLPDDLTGEGIDGLLSRMTDTQIRVLLHDELQQRARENAVTDENQISLLEQARLRLEKMVMTIDKRVRRWVVAIWNIESRLPKMEERLETASAGISVMIFAALFLGFIGYAATLVVKILTQKWVNFLVDVDNARYWDRVIRTIALAAVELLQVAAFVFATQIATPILSNWLGPLNGLVWIYYAGVWNGWAFLILMRRILAPFHPQVRISSITDIAATSVYALIRRVAIFGVVGWVLAGLSPNLGLGFPPALVIVTLTGTIITFYLLYNVFSNYQEIKNFQTNVILARMSNVQLQNVVSILLPILFCIYIVFAWIVWIAVWLERGVHNLNGPIGTIFVLLFIPLFERLGNELITSNIQGDTQVSQRMRIALRNSLRVLIAIVAFLVIFYLWGIDIIATAKGENAPIWANTLFDITLTVLLGQLIWQIVSAFLYTEKREGAGSEDADPDAAGASRLETLIPVFRNILLGILAIVIGLIILSALGVDVGPLIASAGIVGIAIGFGAQTLVRDIFSGIFFLIDDAFRVGEYIELEGDLRGEVETITIRSLQLRNHRGPVINIPFGEIKQITNHSRDWVIYKMEFRLEPDTDPQQVKRVVKKVGAEFMEHPDHGPKFIEPLKSQGVKSIDDDSALIVRVKFKCLPRTQFVLRREIYHRIHAVFAENGIYFAKRKIEVVGPEGDPIDDKMKAAIPEDMLQKPQSAG